VELREAGIDCPILVMGGYYGPASKELLHFRLTPVLVDQGQVERLATDLSRTTIPGPMQVHLKLDTGMGRLGVRREHWQAFAKALSGRAELRLGGLMTHFSSADGADPEVLAEPLAAFEDATRVFRSAGVEVGCRHAANSAAVLRSASSHFQMVRPGVALYGVDPLEAKIQRAEDPAAAGKLRPVMSVTSRIVSLRDLSPGDTVGYGARYRADRPARIATVPIGYADGLSRSLSGCGALVVRGQRAPIAGVVSMDMTTIDVTEIPEVSIGDEVVLLGSQTHQGKTARITAEEIADWMGSIAWEVLTNISRRVPRFYRQA
jgi:alanine racemase